MAVQKSKKTRSRRDMRRSHDRVSTPTYSQDSTTGELHRRHHLTADGYYKGELVRPLKEDNEDEED